jgi:hypothetical protein
LNKLLLIDERIFFLSPLTLLSTSLSLILVHFLLFYLVSHPPSLFLTYKAISLSTHSNVIALILHLIHPLILPLYSLFPSLSLYSSFPSLSLYSLFPSLSLYSLFPSLTLFFFFSSTPYLVDLLRIVFIGRHESDIVKDDF